MASVPAGAGGWYQCTAYSEAGSCVTRARLVVDSPPARPTQQTKIALNLPYPSRVIQPEYDNRLTAVSPNSVY